MAREIDSAALTAVQKQLGMSGVGPSSALLLDEDLPQSFDVIPAVRRSLADIATRGQFYGTLQNVHAAAGPLVSQINPYDATTRAFGTFPAPVPEDFDLWLMGCSIQRVSGTGTVEAAIEMEYFSRMRGFGAGDNDAPASARGRLTLMFVDTIVTIASSPFGIEVIHRSGRVLSEGLPLRLGRNDCFLHFFTEATALSTYDATFMLGLFPAGLGSDA